MSFSATFQCRCVCTLHADVEELTDTELSDWAGRSGSLKPSRTPLPLCLAIATLAGVASLAFHIIGTYCVPGGRLLPCTPDNGIQEVNS